MGSVTQQVNRKKYIIVVKQIGKIILLGVISLGFVYIARSFGFID